LRDTFKYGLGGSVVVAGVAVGALWQVSQAPVFEISAPAADAPTVVESQPAVPRARVTDAGSPEAETVDKSRVRSALFGVIFTPDGESYWDQPVYECRWLANGGEFSISFGYADDGAPWASCDPAGENRDLCGCMAALLEASPPRPDLRGGLTDYRMPDTRFTFVHELRDQIARRLP